LRALIFDPFSGASGDMTIAALLDLGLSEDWLRTFIRSLDLGDIDVTVTRAMRRGIDCARIEFKLPHEHAHRHLRHVVEIIEKSGAPAAAKERAIDAFRRIAIAEAAVHGTTVEKVHFHEVGALDAILDVLCTMAAVEELGFRAFFTQPVALGSGWIDIAHGRFPVPAPATLRILEGIATTGLDLEGECTTPTGAAIIASLTRGVAPPRGISVNRTGFGAGTRDPQDRPNCLRLIAADVAEPEADGHGETEPPHGSSNPGDRLFMLQADIDDMPAEYVAAAQDAALAAGALDAVVFPVSMKKGRPGQRIEILCTAGTRDAVMAAVFGATSTIGIRYWPVERVALERSVEARTWRGQSISYKRVTLPDGTSRAKPEYEDVVKAAATLGLSAWEVRRQLELGTEGDAT
jgi:uncharacterized protein (TIGR00299 family) protein